jgi:hypothetical protein
MIITVRHVIHLEPLVSEPIVHYVDQEYTHFK